MILKTLDEGIDIIPIKMMRFTKPNRMYFVPLSALKSRAPPWNCPKLWRHINYNNVSHAYAITSYYNEKVQLTLCFLQLSLSHNRIFTKA